AGDLEAALRQMDRSLELQPGALWPTFYKGCCSYRLGRCDDAVVAFSVCLALAPDSPWCWYNRGLAYARLGRLDRALSDLDRPPPLAPPRRGAGGSCPTARAAAPRRGPPPAGPAAPGSTTRRSTAGSPWSTWPAGTGKRPFGAPEPPCGSTPVACRRARCCGN